MEMFLLKIMGFLIIFLFIWAYWDAVHGSSSEKDDFYMDDDETDIKDP